jgi:hypothetical protein
MQQRGHGVAWHSLGRIERGERPLTHAVLTALTPVLNCPALLWLYESQEAHKAVAAYVQHYPQHAKALAELVHWARQTGFTQWEQLTEQIRPGRP